jgi:hypothetical protein
MNPKDIKIIEFFAGRQSFSKAARKKGIQTFTTDIVDFKGIDYVTDIMDFDPKEVPFKPNVVWCSVPCESFSVSSIGHNWNLENGIYTPTSQRARDAIKVVKTAIKWIEYYNPKYYFIENPMGMLRKMPMMKKLPKRKTVTYCQYGDHRMKPTDIWTNSTVWRPKLMCNYGDPCHDAAPRGSRTGTQGMANATDRSEIPAQLCTEIINSIVLEKSVVKAQQKRIQSISKKYHHGHRI